MILELALVKGRGWIWLSNLILLSKLTRYLNLYCMTHSHGTSSSPLHTIPAKTALAFCVSSIQDAIYVLGKAHMRCTLPVRSFPNLAFETVSMLVWLTMALSHHFKEDCRVLPLSTPVSSKQLMVWCPWLWALRKCLKLLDTSDQPRRKFLVPVALPASHFPSLRHVQSSTSSGVFKGGCHQFTLRSRLPIPLFTFCSKLIDRARMMACVFTKGCFTSTESIRTMRPRSPGWPPQLSHSSCALMACVVCHLLRKSNGEHGWLLLCPLSSWRLRPYRLCCLYGWQSYLAWQWSPTLTSHWCLSHRCIPWDFVVIGCFLEWEAWSLTQFCLCPFLTVLSQVNWQECFVEMPKLV